MRVYVVGRELSAAPSDSVVVFNELMYHPAATDAAGEWLELYNQMGVDVDVSGWRLSGGIGFTFPDGTVIGGGEYLVVAANPGAVAGSIGPFSGALDNGGETINLRDNSDRLMDSLEYGDDWPWPPAADGGGASVAKTSPLKPTGDNRRWRASLARGGTPGGGEDFLPAPDLRLSEVAAGGSDNFFVELYNSGETAAQLLGVQIVSSDGAGVHTFSTGTIAAGAYLSIDAGTLGFTPLAGQRLYLTSPGERRYGTG